MTPEEVRALSDAELDALVSEKVMGNTLPDGFEGGTSMNLSRDTFGHDDEIGRLFEEYDRLVRWEEHNSRLDATDPVVERAAARGRIVAFIANTATLQQDAHTSIAEPEPQDVEEAWARHATIIGIVRLNRRNGIIDDLGVLSEQGRARGIVEQAIRTDERTRWAEREQQLVEALDDIERPLSACDAAGNPACSHVLRALGYISTARAALTQERPA